MATLALSDFIAPENLHELARARFTPVGEILPQREFTKEPGGAGTVRVPPSPDAFAVALAVHEQSAERVFGKRNPAVTNKLLANTREYEISRAAAVAGHSAARVHENAP